MKRSLETVKSRPILMQAESVRAILDGRKTQTRRIVKALPPHAQNVRPCADYLKCDNPEPGGQVSLRLRCPYGEAGDSLYVKETFGYHDSHNDVLFYKADELNYLPNPFVACWHPSIFMKRSDSRITLEICAVRAQKLQNITEEDAYAEGCLAVCGPGMAILKNCREVYRDLWESIHGKGAWERNDWVWVIDFRRITL